MMPGGQAGGGGMGPLGMMLTLWVKRLMIATAVISIGGVILSRWVGVNVAPLLVLRPVDVWGQGSVGFPALWQLVTWPFFTPGVFGLIFAVLMYGWFGGTMESWWGSRRFLRFFLIVTGVTGVVTVLLGLVWPTLAANGVAGAWPFLEALLVAFGLTFPDREIRLYMVLPIKGIHFVWLAVGLLVLRIIFAGAVAPFVPEAVAMAVGAAVVTGGWRFGTLGLRARKWWLETQIKQEQARRKRRVERAEHLKVVDREEKERESRAKREGKPGDGGDDRPSRGNGTHGGWLN